MPCQMPIEPTEQLSGVKTSDNILERYVQLCIVNNKNQIAPGLSLRRVATPPHIPTVHCEVCLMKEILQPNICYVCGGFFPSNIKTAHQVLCELSSLFRTRLNSTRAVY